MRKLITLLLAAAMSFSVTACSNQNPVKADEPLSLDGEISGEISISCYDTTSYKDYLEQSAKAFQEKYPNTKVNIIPFSVMPEMKSTVSENGSITTLDKDSIAINDYINRTNTELMSGEGADLLAMDVLPYYKYAESGQIEDLKPYMEADETFHKDEYFQNIIDAMKYKGGQYIFPMDFSFDFVSIESSMLDQKALEEIMQKKHFTYDELAKIGQESFEKANANAKIPVRMFDSYEPHKEKEVFIELFKQDYNTFLDIEKRKANFKDGKFVSFLETVDSYMAQGYFIPKDTVFDDSQPSLFRKQFYFSLPYDAEDEKLNGLITNETGEVIFECGQGYAINANSQNKKTAWAFIKFMAGEELQSSAWNLLSCPININALKEAARINITATDMNMDDDGIEIKFSEDEKVLEAYKNYLQLLNQYSEMLNSYLIQDSVINQIISKEAEHYFDGTITAMELSEILQSKVELYLNE